MVPDYVIQSNHSIINRFDVHPEYDDNNIKFKYTVIPIDNIGEIIDTEKYYSYGALSNLRECDYVSIDIDKIPAYINYIENNKFKKYRGGSNPHKTLSFIIKQIFLEFKEANIIERIDIFRSSSKEKGLVIPLHLYIKLKEAVDVEPIYKNYFMIQIMCGGHLSFINYNSFINIRIDAKFNEPMPSELSISSAMKWVSSKDRTKITPLCSYEPNGKVYHYPEYTKWKNKIIEWNK